MVSTRSRPATPQRTRNPRKPPPVDSTATDDTTTPTKRSARQASKPLKVGTKLLCRMFDGEYYPAEILEKRKINNDVHEYYLHYTEFDRRLDEWVKLERLDLGSLEKVVDRTKKGQEPDTTRTRSHWRKIREDKKDHDGLDPVYLLEHQKITKVKNIASIELGRYEIDTWYFSPFPPEFDNSPKLYLCEFCLHCMKTRDQLLRHRTKCDLKHPPGDEIYRTETLSMFEVDGEKSRVYCQNLCYTAKLFLDHKTLFDDVHDFLFYILCECDDRGCHIVAYFSKEKQSAHSFNLACILTFPPYQKKGYGKFLISFSYELSKKEGKAGTPEKPLSDLGELSYKKYWTRVLLDILKNQDSEISIRELSERTAMLPNDVYFTLNELKLIQLNKQEMQYICTDQNILDFHLKEAGPAGPKIDTTKLIWSPYKEKRTSSPRGRERDASELRPTHETCSLGGLKSDASKLTPTTNGEHKTSIPRGPGSDASKLRPTTNREHENCISGGSESDASKLTPTTNGEHEGSIPGGPETDASKLRRTTYGEHGTPIPGGSMGGDTIKFIPAIGMQETSSSGGPESDATKLRPTTYGECVTASPGGSKSDSSQLHPTDGEHDTSISGGTEGDASKLMPPRKNT